MLLDLSADFDNVEVYTLISKLSSYFGVRDLAAKWFQSYMSNILFKVEINEKSSNWIKLQLGIPHARICTWTASF